MSDAFVVVPLSVCSVALSRFVMGLHCAVFSLHVRVTRPAWLRDGGSRYRAKLGGCFGVDGQCGTTAGSTRPCANIGKAIWAFQQRQTTAARLSHHRRLPWRPERSCGL